MKKIFTLITLVLITTITSAQARLGFTADEIIQKDYTVTYKAEVTDQGNTYIYYNTSFSTIMHLLDKDNTCFATVEIPFNNVGKSIIIERLNSKHVIKNPFTWWAYLDNGLIIKIELTYDEQTELWMFSHTFLN